MLLVSLSLVVVFLELAHGLVPSQHADGGNGLLTTGRRYLPNREVELDIAHGNLGSIGGAEVAQRVGVARRSRWVTDSRGYRNSRHFAEPSLVVVGDSFIAGVHASQADTLPEQLIDGFGIDALSLGHPGSLWRYQQTLEANEDLFAAPRDPALFVYVFEGNDFRDASPEPWRWLTHRSKRRNEIVAFYRERLDSFGWVNELWAKIWAEPPDVRVRIAAVAGHELAFFRDYDDVTQRNVFAPHRKFERALDALLLRADALFFIPTKSRVYQPWTEPNTPLPNAQWDALQAAVLRAGDTLAVNLTDALRRRAAELLPAGEFVFWPDDTHWNGAGIRVAAEESARVYAELAGRRRSSN
jgi:hypothetical protein